MRVMVQCLDCAFAPGTPSTPTELLVDLVDDCVVKFTCGRGHPNTLVLQQQKFELLSELSAMALLDGYFREAVATMATVLERFFEFYVKTVCLSRQVPVEQLSNAWSNVKSQSERQLGAFMFLYLIDQGESFQIPGRRAEFRNKVVHSGYIPTQQEAIEYIEWVFNSVRDTGTKLREKHFDASNAVIKQDVEERARRYAGSTPVGTYYHAMLFNWADMSWHTKEFKTELDDLRERRGSGWGFAATR